MHVDHLIIGQGICGTFLSWYLQKANRSFIIFDEASQNTASRVAAGIINPVTGRRIVKTWMIDELIPFAQTAYSELTSALNVKTIRETSIIDFFPTPQMKLAFDHRHEKDSQYISIPREQTQLKQYFYDNFGFGEINSCLLVNLQDILPAYRQHVSDHIVNENFDLTALVIKNEIVSYNNITADSIIFCDGASGGSNPYFSLLPFAPNKGEILWIECKDPPNKDL